MARTPQTRPCILCLSEKQQRYLGITPRGWLSHLTGVPQNEEIVSTSNNKEKEASEDNLRSHEREHGYMRGPKGLLIGYMEILLLIHEITWIPKRKPNLLEIWYRKREREGEIILWTEVFDAGGDVRLWLGPRLVRLWGFNEVPVSSAHKQLSLFFCFHLLWFCL